MYVSEIVLPSESDAEAVLEAMKSLLNKYKWVTVGDFLELVSFDSTFHDLKLGWTNLESVEVKPAHGGFILSLPDAQPI